MKNIILHRIKSNVCPKYEGLPGKLGTHTHCYRAQDYARYERCECESDNSHTIFETLCINHGKNLFHGLNLVSAPGLHKPDLLHTVYLELFKHIIDWIKSFLKKHTQRQAFDDA